MSNKLAIAALALACAFSSVPAFAADEANTVPGLTAVGAPLGLHGVDPVALLRDGNPNYAAVMDGKLYVFLNKEIFGLYKKDEQGTIDKAAVNWTKIKHTAATEL